MSRVKPRVVTHQQQGQAQSKKALRKRTNMFWKKRRAALMPSATPQICLRKTCAQRKQSLKREPSAVWVRTHFPGSAQRKNVESHQIAFNLAGRGQLRRIETRLSGSWAMTYKCWHSKAPAAHAAKTKTAESGSSRLPPGLAQARQAPAPPEVPLPRPEGRCGPGHLKPAHAWASRHFSDADFGALHALVVEILHARISGAQARELLTSFCQQLLWTWTSESSRFPGAQPS